MTSRIRRRTATAALFLLAPAAAACGFGAQTDQIYQPTVGVNSLTGQTNVMNAVIVSGHDGAGTFAGSLVNNSASTPDVLQSVTGEGITATERPVQIPVDQVVNLSTSTTVVISGPTIQPGNFVRITLEFRNGQTTKLNVPVVANTDDFAAVPVPDPGSTPDQAAGAAPGN